jgi:hypothetical protein
MGTDLRARQDYLEHRDPKHTAHYTRVASNWSGWVAMSPSMRSLRWTECKQLPRSAGKTSRDEFLLSHCLLNRGAQAYAFAKR